MLHNFCAKIGVALEDQDAPENMIEKQRRGRVQNAHIDGKMRFPLQLGGKLDRDERGCLFSLRNVYAYVDIVKRDVVGKRAVGISKKDVIPSFDDAGDPLQYIAFFCGRYSVGSLFHVRCTHLSIRPASWKLSFQFLVSNCELELKQSTQN